MRRLLTIRNAVLCLSLLLPLAGCSQKLRIQQIPDFYTPDLKSIAVAPFRNQTGWQGAGEAIADKLANELMANGSYQVCNRNDLKTLLNEQDLQLALGGSAAGKNSLRKLTNVQAILVGTVTTYAATSNNQPRTDPIYAYDRNGNQYVSGYRQYVWTRNEANVHVTAALIRVSDGATIYATPSALSARSWAEGSPPTKDRHACAGEAADLVVDQLVETFAPVYKTIEVNPKEAFRTASDLYDNKWTYADTFGRNDKKMFVVLSLPPSCDRNHFRITIIKKDQRTDLAVQDVVWSKKHAGFGYAFNPQELYSKGGEGDYEAKFYSGPEPVLRCAFRIK